MKLNFPTGFAMQKIDKVNKQKFTYIEHKINCLHACYIDIKHEIEKYKAVSENPSKNQEETKNEEGQSQNKHEQHKECLMTAIKKYLEAGVAGGAKK